MLNGILKPSQIGFHLDNISHCRVLVGFAIILRDYGFNSIENLILKINGKITNLTLQN